MVSVAITSAPAHRQSCISRRPIGPCPTTSTVCPLPTPALPTAFRQVFTGSTKAASSGRTPSGMAIAPRSTIQSMRLHELREPAARGLEAGRGAVALVALALRVGAPRRSRSSAPQGMWWWRATRSPSRKRPRPRLAATTVPAISWPKIRGPGQQALLDLLDVGPADAAGVDADQHLAGPDLGHGHVLDPQVARAPVDRRFHGHKGAILARGHRRPQIMTALDRPVRWPRSR